MLKLYTVREYRYSMVHNVYMHKIDFILQNIDRGEFVSDCYCTHLTDLHKYFECLPVPIPFTCSTECVCCVFVYDIAGLLGMNGNFLCIIN